jgi:hypothetical protein
MKKLLISLLVLGSPSSYAMTAPEGSLSENGERVQERKKYDHRYVNDDGSVTFVRPKFSNPDGSGSLRISVQNGANLIGVCKLLGEGSFVPNSDTYEPPAFQTLLVRVSGDGSFEGFDKNDGEMKALRSLICSPAKQSKMDPSRNAENIVNNDDGSITIVRPKFSNPDGAGGLRLSFENDLNLSGICKLFGARSYVPHSALPEVIYTSLYEAAWHKFVRISSKGRFERFDRATLKDPIKSLMCRR